MGLCHVPAEGQAVTTTHTHTPPQLVRERDSGWWKVLQRKIRKMVEVGWAILEGGVPHGGLQLPKAPKPGTGRGCSGKGVLPSDLQRTGQCTLPCPQFLEPSKTPRSSPLNSSMPHMTI